MPNELMIEDIEAMRRHAGIDDVALREEIRALRAGDFVKLSLVTPNGRCETLRVRITSIKGSTIRGRVASVPAPAARTRVRRGALISFTGPRVVQQTTREKLPDDFGLAESNLRFGHLDAIVRRPELRRYVGRVLRLFANAR